MLPEQEWQVAVRCCLRRVATWMTPSNWSRHDWMEEMYAEAEAAGWKAACEYTASQACTLFQFVYQHSLNACLQRYRQEWRYVLHCPHTLDVVEHPEADSADLYAAIDSLPESDRQLLHQLYWARFTETELAQQQGVSVQAISKRKRAALRKLRAMMR
ncbi:MAG: sigma-70 family RNA polymerase sigma factor [bacterium]|nr:sigma-70 family RNA polymerase sigma factor [bacterium]